MQGFCCRRLSLWCFHQAATEIQALSPRMLSKTVRTAKWNWNKRVSTLKAFLFARYCFLRLYNTPGTLWLQRSLYALSRQYEVVNLRMLASCCIRNYKPLEKTRSLHNLGIRIFRFLHFNSLFVTVKYASNMAAWFHVQFSAVTLNSINSQF